MSETLRVTRKRFSTNSNGFPRPKEPASFPEERENLFDARENNLLRGGIGLMILVSLKNTRKSAYKADTTQSFDGVPGFKGIHSENM